MIGIADMFRELDGYDRLADAYAREFPQRCAAAVAAMADWRRANPRRARELLRRSVKKWKAANPDKERAAKRRHDAANREHMREVWKRNQAARRSRRKGSA